MHGAVHLSEVTRTRSAHVSLNAYLAARQAEALAAAAAATAASERADAVSDGQNQASGKCLPGVIVTLHHQRL